MIFRRLRLSLLRTRRVFWLVSEPLLNLPGAWNEVPESSYGVVREGEDEMHPFTPIHTGIGS